MRAVCEQYVKARFKMLPCLWSTGPWVSICSRALYINHVQRTFALYWILCGLEDNIKVALGA